MKNIFVELLYYNLSNNATLIITQMPNPIDPSKTEFKFGRTVQISSSQYKIYIQIACDTNNREGIINILLNNGERKQKTTHINPNIYRPKSEFKYNLFDSSYSSIFII